MLFFLTIIKTTVTATHKQDQKSLVQNEKQDEFQLKEKVEAMRQILHDYEIARNNINCIINEVDKIISQILVLTKSYVRNPQIADARNDKILEGLLSNLKSQMNDYKRQRKNIRETKNNTNLTNFIQWCIIFKYNSIIFLKIKDSEIKSILKKTTIPLHLSTTYKKCGAKTIQDFNTVFDNSLKLLECTAGEDQSFIKRDENMKKINEYYELIFKGY